MKHKLLCIALILLLACGHATLALAQGAPAAGAAVTSAIAGLTASAAGVPAVTATASATEKFSTDYRIDPENVLIVEVYYGKDEKFSRQVRVSSTGDINLPYVGDVAAAGLTVGDLQKKINKLFDKGESIPPQSNVLVQEYSTVSILGEVKMPGAYPIKSTLTVLELISLAQGLNESASANEVKVIHTNLDGTKTTNAVRVYDIMNKGAALGDNIFLHSRDVVIVPKSIVTIVGEVKAPGSFPIRGYLSLVELVALAGGFNDVASPNEVKIIHTNADGTKTQRVAALYDIMNRQAIDNDNLLLSSGDVVIVPKSMVTIMGEVKFPGTFPIRSYLTASELIALAGGFNDVASPSEVKIIHTHADGTKTQRLAPLYATMSKDGTDSDNLLLSAGDMVIVAKSTVTIIGEVTKPGVYPTRGHLTLIDLVAMAEGFTKFAAPNEVKVIHNDTTGRKSERTVPVYDMMKKGAIDDDSLLLANGDVIFVR